MGEGMSPFPHLTEATLESIKADADAESFYPADWPHCPACGDYALDGHITCGRLECAESAHRDLARQRQKLRST
jgi:hypothetical protein